MILSRIEPWGDELKDLHNAQLCAVVYNGLAAVRATIIRAMGGKKTRPKFHKPKDFMLWRPPRKKKGWQEQLRLVEMLNAAFGGDDKRSKKQ